MLSNPFSRVVSVADMSLFSSSSLRLAGLFSILIGLCVLPIWSVENFVNQDGSPHLYNGYVMLELLRGNPAFTQVYALNSAPIPNLTGHWLLTFLLLIFSPPIITKIMVSGIFAALAAAVGWFHYQIIGRKGLLTALLFGTVLAYNWMWLLGFYNFMIGVIGFIFTLGLYWRWREQINFYRGAILSFLLIFVFFSHLISFLMLAGSILILSLFAAAPHRKKAVISIILTLLPVIPLLVGYKLLTTSGGAAFPVWRFLSDPFSFSGWIAQLQTADPFQLLSRKAFPFVVTDSKFFAVFTPTIWLTAAIFLLLAAGFGISKKEFVTRQTLPFTLLSFASILCWVFAPDDFGKSHGGFLRERVLLCGLIFLIPLFGLAKPGKLKNIAHIFLFFVIVFQNSVLWEYSLRTDRLASEYLSGKNMVSDTDALGSIDLIENGCRFKANPLSNIIALYGVGKNTRIWDDYEVGYYLFPVVVRNSSDSQFVNDFRQASTFELCDARENTDLQFAALDSLLELQHDKISVILVWGNDERTAAVLKNRFEEQPFYQNGRLHLFRHRQQ